MVPLPSERIAPVSAFRAPSSLKPENFPANFCALAGIDVAMSAAAPKKAATKNSLRIDLPPILIFVDSAQTAHEHITDRLSNPPNTINFVNKAPSPHSSLASRFRVSALSPSNGDDLIAE